MADTTLYFHVRPDDRRLLRDLQVKYSKDYLPFITAIVKSSPTPKHLTLLKIGQDIIRHIGSLLSGSLPVNTGKNLLGVVHKLMDDFDKGLNLLLEEEGAEVYDPIVKLENKTGKDFFKLVEKHTQISSLTKEEIKPESINLLKHLKTSSPEAYDFGKTGLSAGMQSLLGPLSPLARMGWGVGKGVYGAVKGLVGRKSKLDNLLTPDGVDEMDFDGAGIGVPEGMGVGRGALQKLATPEPMVSFPSLASPVSQKLTGQSLANASDPLYYFFDKGAYKASWSAELLSLFKRSSDQSGKVGGKGGSGFGDALSGGVVANLVRKMWPALLAGGGIALTSFLASYMAGEASKRMDVLYDKNPEVAKRVNLFQTVMTNALPVVNIVDSLRNLSDPLHVQKRQAGSYQKLGQDIVDKGIPYVSKEFVREQKEMTSQFADLNKNLLSNATNFSEKLKMLVNTLAPLLFPLSSLVSRLAGKTAKALPSFAMNEPAPIDKGPEIAPGSIRPTDVAGEQFKMFEAMNKQLEDINNGISNQLKNLSIPVPTPSTGDVSYGNKNSLMDGVVAGRVGLSGE